MIVAAVVAVLGAGMVYLYVQGADDRAQAEQAPVEVLKVIAQIEPGETLADAQAEQKVELQPVPSEQVLAGALTSVGDLGAQVALQRIFVGEQVTASKFGSAGEQDALTLDDGEIAISVTLSDTGRVAGFVNPGAEVALFFNGPVGPGGDEGVRVLLPSVKIIAVGQTTVTTATTTTAAGAQTVEDLPKTLITLGLKQADAQKVMFASTRGELVFGLKNEKSKVRPGQGVTIQNLFG
ncbi:Flp pilus assembly protein CpaB [Nocardioides sp. HDW12B]|uniref:Flp pilus assembly protein CpaB n=1 Tax=Nocardioides sp. HDW12B TaxID=2714939 RepID=UPI00140788CC|nr:Flp pilus assembly protein CpaB [Nocardioides sp. HDW12B]QIK66080.1 Flp pilus assembly protein CpaB [Nocardioides sp. HDW12B]